MGRQRFFQEHRCKEVSKARESPPLHFSLAAVVNFCFAMDEDYHLKQLSQHCCVYCTASECKYSVKQHKTDLQAVFGLLVGEDTADIHPQSFCHMCYCTMKRSRRELGLRLFGIGTLMETAR